MASEMHKLQEAKSLTAGELLDDRLKTLSSGLYARARFLSVSFDDRKPSKPCTQVTCTYYNWWDICSWQFPGLWH